MVLEAWCATVSLNVRVKLSETVLLIQYTIVDDD